MTRRRAPSDGQELLPLDVAIDPARVLRTVPGPTGPVEVTVAGVVAEIDEALAVCQRVIGMRNRMRTLAERPTPDPRQRAARLGKSEWATTLAGYVGPSRRLLEWYRAALTTEEVGDETLADSAVAVRALTGQPGYDTARPRIPSGVVGCDDGPHVGDLAVAVEDLDGLEEYLAVAGDALAFDDDRASLRRQLAVYRGLRPGDRVEFVDATRWAALSLEERRAAGTGHFTPSPHRIHLAARPTLGVVARGTQPVAQPERLTAAQVDALCRSVAQGDPPSAALAALPGATGRLTVADVVTSLTRYGIWLAQSLLASVDVRRALAEADRDALVRRLLATVRFTERPGAQTLGVTGDVVHIDRGWGDHEHGGADPARLAVALHRPQTARWYRVVRGDIADLQGLTPLRDTAFVAMAADLASGHPLSVSAAWSGRPLRMQMHAYDRAAAFGRREAAALQALARIQQALASGDPGSDAGPLLDEGLRLLATLDVDTSRVAEQVAVYREAAGRSRRVAADQLLSLAAAIRDEVTRIADGVPTENPAGWSRAMWDRFRASQSDLAPRSDRDALRNSDLLRNVRAYAQAAYAQPGAPVHLVEVYADLHECLATALRRNRPPRWPGYLNTVRALNGEPWNRTRRLHLRRAITAAFAEWPDMVTRIENSSTLLRPLYA